ncbi:uncharacterized protein H6S33_007885 [Morchella sextelata]|uniref:uncharacterized protein n=1 Tax=Morchella sextelata TaxID=1174677 RepID=UPI001D038E01|nr:uncharacterized protein H6S33_007885 [Morchella sextelata]KAH0603563.1 hypothetical protein H6S33_007885 [Morchella sextelata]
MAKSTSEVPVNVLCIEPDSGFRCLLSLLLVDDLMTRVTQHMETSRRTPIRHVFDLVGGEGSGGIVALLVGRLGRSIASGPGILRDMMSKFCPWGGTKRNALGIHRNKPFVSNCVQPAFERLDEEDESKVYYNKDSVRTCILASLEQAPQGKRFSRKIKDWAERVRVAIKVIPMKLYSRLKAGKFYSTMLFSTEKITDPTITTGPSTYTLKERFRTYDQTLSRANVYISDVAQATFTHDNLVAPKIINGRSYGSAYPSTNAILDIIDESNVLFPDRPLGVVVRIGGEFMHSLDTPSLGRTGEKEHDGFLEKMPNMEIVFQIPLPEVQYEAELMDEPERVLGVFDKWIKNPQVVDRLERCAEALCNAGIKERSEWYPRDAVKDIRT